MILYRFWCAAAWLYICYALATNSVTSWMAVLALSLIPSNIADVVDNISKNRWVLASISAVSTCLTVWFIMYAAVR